MALDRGADRTQRSPDRSQSAIAVFFSSVFDFDRNRCLIAINNLPIA
jgi:hypothetical protein